MKITKENGLYHATIKLKGKVFLGYSPDRSEAIGFCCELVLGE